MVVQIRPEPPDDVREALERVVERALAEDAAPSEWWLSGIRESVGLDED